MSDPAYIFLVSSLYLISFGGLSFVMLQAIHSGAEAYSNVYTVEASRQFEDIFLFIPPNRLTEVAWSLSAAVFLLVFFLTGSLESQASVVRGVACGAVAGVTALQTPKWLLALLRIRRRHRFNNQLVDALVSMSNSLKAGFSIMQTVESEVQKHMNPLSQEFGILLHETRIGLKFEDALNNMEERVQSEDLTLVVRAIEIARQTGGNLTEVFETIAATIRERMRIEGRIRTLTAQGRLQGIIIGIMPLLLCGALLLIDPGMMIPFLKSKVGIIIIAAVLVLESIGAVFIRKIIRINV